MLLVLMRSNSCQLTNHDYTVCIQQNLWELYPILRSIERIQANSLPLPLPVPHLIVFPAHEQT